MFLWIVGAGLILLLCGLILMYFSNRIQNVFTLPTVADLVQEQQRQATYANVTCQPQAGVITIGRVISGEYFASHIGVVIHGIICRFTEYLLDRNIIVLGEIGSGKTTAVLTLMQQTALYTMRDCYFINFKGQPEDDEKARRILAEKRGAVPIIRMDPDNPGFPYNPFKYGDGLSIANRWMRVFGVDRTIGRTDEHYGSLAASVILLICLGGTEPPRSLAAFRARMNDDWLKKNYPKDHPDHHLMVMATTAEKGQHTPLQRLQIRSIAIFKQFERFIAEDGWTPDDGSAVISVPASKIPETAQAIAGVLVEDFKHYMSARQQRPAQIFWDEFQAARNDSITEFLSQARSFHCGAVLATQDINKLGNDLEQKALTSDTTTLISFRTQQSADFVAHLSGSVKKPATSFQVREGVEDSYSVREETEYRIHPNDVAQLPDGYCFVLRQRTFCKVLFNEPVIPGHDDVAAEPIYTPPPVPSGTGTNVPAKSKAKPEVTKGQINF